MAFYAEPITVTFDREPLLEKKPGPPAAFTWRGKSYIITALIKEWHDYRKQKSTPFSSKNRQTTPEMTSDRGSWGVGRDYYRVQTDSGEIFDIYYDRKPKRQKKGEWILLRKIDTP